MEASRLCRMLVCLSITRFRSVSSGSEFTADTRFCVLPSNPSVSSSPPMSVFLFTSATSALYFCSPPSASSATLGNAALALATQKGSLCSNSYVFLLTGAPGAWSRCTVTRLRLRPRLSCTRGWYVHTCCMATASSKLRSNMQSSGLWKEELDEVSVNRLLRATRWSRSRLSSSEATISAAPPLGARMYGTTPMVTRTLNSPLTMVPTAASTSVSLAVGSLSCT
mmetsp:Transcript_4659/g.8828  ORF Transcript_4659/g.8828 Transcript_4659/m.8828 type:complete len:224 (-) Transcript_4659:553-1224(-)